MEPEIGGRAPILVELEAGQKYYWCSCGRSRNQPFCDGSHAGSEFTPKEIEVAVAKKAALCTCKRTANQPYCDGGHATLAGK